MEEVRSTGCTPATGGRPDGRCCRDSRWTCRRLGGSYKYVSSSCFFSSSRALQSLTTLALIFVVETDACRWSLGVPNTHRLHRQPGGPARLARQRTPMESASSVSPVDVAEGNISTGGELQEGRSRRVLHDVPLHLPSLAHVLLPGAAMMGEGGRDNSSRSGGRPPPCRVPGGDASVVLQ
jgi:hypothetical protein